MFGKKMSLVVVRLEDEVWFGWFEREFCQIGVGLGAR